MNLFSNWKEFKKNSSNNSYERTFRRWFWASQRSAKRFDSVHQFPDQFSNLQHFRPSTWHLPEQGPLLPRDMRNILMSLSKRIEILHWKLFKTKQGLCHLRHPQIWHLRNRNQVLDWSKVLCLWSLIGLSFYLPRIFLVARFWAETTHGKLRTIFQD